MRRKYEFVDKEEYNPVKIQLNTIMQKANSYLLNNAGIQFKAQIVGSGRRGLITREVGGNKGFDFDYNLVLPMLADGGKYDAKAVNDCFMNAFRYAVEGTKWSGPMDSTTVLTIKVKDTKNSKITHSCDFAIVYYDSGGMLHYRRNHKDTGGYGFQIRQNSKCVDEKVSEICDYYVDGFEVIKQKYLLLKNRNEDENKKSFLLYIEAVNDAYNEMCMDRNS